MSPADTINVNEVFYSIQGEGTRSGLPCLFIRLQGCKLRCVWCDTPYALDPRIEMRRMTYEQVLEEVRSAGCSFIEFTGGEPLEQPAVLPMMARLCDEGYTVAVETGGHVDITGLDPRVTAILDVKCPDSKMSSLNRLENLQQLRPHDEVKFVIASRVDYDYAREIIRTYNLTERTAAALLSCVFDKLPFIDLVTWMLEDRLEARFQLQIHKFVWSPETRGV